MCFGNFDEMLLMKGNIRFFEPTHKISNIYEDYICIHMNEKGEISD